MIDVRVTQSDEPVSLLPLLTIYDVAHMLKVTRPTVYQMMYSQGLPYIKLGAAVRISKTSLERWLVEQEQQRG